MDPLPTILHVIIPSGPMSDSCLIGRREGGGQEGREGGKEERNGGRRAGREEEKEERDRQ